MRPRALAACLGFATLLAGCAGLPSKPVPPSLPAAAPIAGLHSVRGRWPTPHWWRGYADPTLDRLIATALASSPSLAVARARFDSARQGVRIAAAASGAHVDLDGSIARQRLSDHGLIPPSLLGFSWYNQANLGLQAHYTFDWWGKQRDAVEAAVDRTQAAQAERSAAALALASAVADAYFGWQADQGRLAIARSEQRTAARARVIAVARAHAGLAPATDVYRRDLDISALGGRIAALEGSARLRTVALAALIGRSQAALPPLVARPLPVVAATMPSDVRIDLLARRPDIVASRWRVEAAERNSLAARAQFLPDISIDALAGLSSVGIGKLLQYGSRDPLASVALHLPIFDAGMLRARYGVTRAQLRAAVAEYDATVIDAAREVATEAATLGAIGAQEAARKRGVEAARKLYASAAARLRQGLSDRRAELTAEMSLLDERDALIELDSASVSAHVALQQALGGGYDGTPRVANVEPIAGKAMP